MSSKNMFKKTAKYWSGYLSENLKNGYFLCEFIPHLNFYSSHNMLGTLVFVFLFKTPQGSHSLQTSSFNLINSFIFGNYEFDGDYKQ